jgi:hypothetical protein
MCTEAAERRGSFFCICVLILLSMCADTGVCGLNGRLLAPTVMHMMLAGLCAATPATPAAAADSSARVLPTHVLHDAHAAAAVPGGHTGLVRRLRFTLLHGARASRVT